jgi:IstB-like ATP binding protein
MIVTSTKPFSKWAIFGDDMAGTAMIDRLIHHREILSRKGDSSRPRGKDTRHPHRRQTRRNHLTVPIDAQVSITRRVRSQPALPTPVWPTFQPA